MDLAWSLPAGPGTPDEGEPALRYELEQALDASFSDATLRYAGPDAASVLTGLREGAHHYRVRAVDAEGAPGPWSEPLVITVEYMGRRTLFVLLATGAVVASLTIAATVSGFLKNR